MSDSLPTERVRASFETQDGDPFDIVTFNGDAWIEFSTEDLPLTLYLSPTDVRCMSKELARHAQ